MNTRFQPALAALAFLASLAVARGEDWTQFRGPNHDGSTPEKIMKKWPATGLREVWKVPLTGGFSAISVGSGKAFTLETRDVGGAPQEVCVALDAATGKELWATPLGAARYDDGGNKGAPGNDGGDGPRSTPSCDDGKVYAYSSRLVLSCFEAATGKVVWQSDLTKEHAGRNIHWQSAASPLLDGSSVFVAGGGPGEALLAFDKQDGHVVWKAEDDVMTQSTPVAATILGERQIIFYTQKGLVSVAPKTGEVLWRYPFKYNVSGAISPVVSGDMVYISAAYGVGASACKISRADGKFTATALWSQPGKTLANHWSTPVESGGYVYGLFGQAQFGRAPLQCVEVATGKVMWTKDGFGPGGCTLVDGQVLVLSDVGDLVLVKATPESYTETARCHVLAGKCWNYASVSGGHIYARSTKEGVCLDVSPQMAQP